MFHVKFTWKANIPGQE